MLPCFSSFLLLPLASPTKPWSSCLCGHQRSHSDDGNDTLWELITLTRCVSSVGESDLELLVCLCQLSGLVALPVSHRTFFTHIMFVLTSLLRLVNPYSMKKETEAWKGCHLPKSTHQGENQDSDLN